MENPKKFGGNKVLFIILAIGFGISYSVATSSVAHAGLNDPLPSTPASSTLPTGTGAGKGVYGREFFSTRQIKLGDGTLTDKEKALKNKFDSCEDLYKSAEELAAKKADEEIATRVRSKCIDKLANLSLDVKIPSLFDLILIAAKKKIMAEIDKACAKVNNAIGSSTNLYVGGSVGGVPMGVGGGLQTGSGSSSGQTVPSSNPSPFFQNNSGGSSNVPGVKF